MDFQLGDKVEVDFGPSGKLINGFYVDSIGYENEFHTISFDLDITGKDFIYINVRTDLITKVGEWGDNKSKDLNGDINNENQTN